jgi:hypothetical protein
VTAIHPDDERHLRLLTAFHYAVAAVAALCACVPLLHMVFGIVLLIKPDAVPSRFTPFGLESLIGILFTVMGGVVAAIGFALAVCLFLAARHLTERRRWTFCFATAVASCTFFPFGTVLGVFTIIVLLRPGVKAALGHVPPAAH